MTASARETCITHPDFGKLAEVRVFLGVPGNTPSPDKLNHRGHRDHREHRDKSGKLILLCALCDLCVSVRIRQ
jgi:hypothetical protein